MDIEKIKNDIVDFKITDNISLENIGYHSFQKKELFHLFFLNLEIFQKNKKKKLVKKLMI